MRWRSALVIAMLVPCMAQASSQQNLQKTQAQLQATRAKAEALSKELKTAERDMASLREDVTNVARAIQKSEAALTASERRLNALSREVSAGEARLIQREADMQRAMLAMLQIERMPAAAMFAQPGNAQDMVRTAAALDTARSTLEQEAAQLKRELAKLSSARADMLKAKERYTADAASLASKRNTLTAQLSKRSALQTTLSKNYQATDADVRRLAREAASLQQLITKLDNSPSTRPPTGSIPARGRTTAPVTGNVVHRFGEKKGESDSWRGMVFRARPSALVVAPAGGEVAFTGPFMNYGPMVLLRHQGGMMSLVAGLARIDVRAKQTVRAGEPLGVMAATGEQNLYVELRENTKPIDPARWFATVSASLGR
ncbi:MAG: hypothetical protein C0436_00780 [Alphaproteobacteria bacterium]|nr:hypothetical protein [Alphaproteobacteria bacterium]